MGDDFYEFIERNYCEYSGAFIGVVSPINRPQVESYIGETFSDYATGFDFTKDFRRKVGDKFRFGKYMAVVISDDYPNLFPPRCKILREINILEKIYYKYTFKLKLIFKETIYSLSRLSRVTFNNRKPKGIKEWVYILNHKYKEIRFNVDNKRQW